MDARSMSIGIKMTLAFIISVLLCFTGCAGDSYSVKQGTPPPASLPSANIPSPEASSTKLLSTPSPSGIDDTKETASIEIEDRSISFPAANGTEQPMQSQKEGEPFFTSLPKTTKSSQELLDSALEFCNASNDFWERGDLDNAVDALDEAYSMILHIDSRQPPDILQQRDDLRYTISQRVLQVYSSRFTVVNGFHKAIPLDMNAEVQKALQMFKGAQREFFLNAYRRSGKYRPAIVTALKEAGLPEELSWLPLIESGFKVAALSKARALGMWQFIASTGYKYGLKRGQWVDERMDPERSTEAAIAYLKELHQIFGDWMTVLAAYNCGEGRVLRVINTQKINYLDHFWDLYKKLPQETAFYVPQFLAVLHIMHDPKAHGFTLPPVDEEIETEMVVINKQISLETMAQQIGISDEVLKELNPALRRSVTPPRTYDLRVPVGKGPVLLAEVDNIPEWRPPAPAPVRVQTAAACVTHKVKKGETLSTIARRYGTSVSAITAQNRLKGKGYIIAGQNLKIPSTRVVYADAVEKSAPKPSSKTATVQTKKALLTKYVVQKGDSLYNIANRFNTTVQEIKALNRLRNSNLSVGQELVISGHPVETAKARSESYKVLKGDSPHSIAEKHQMELADLLRMNRLTPRSTIFPGQTLIVKNQ
ncbi:MAG: LysM peptidoglycan-binding domain-containing protein [Candidatus Desulfacyla sp.]